MSPSLRRAPGRALGVIASLVGLASVVAAVILVLYIVLIVFKANPKNVIVHDVKDIARPLAWIFKDLFTPKSLRVRVLVNYGIAAIVYLVARRLKRQALRGARTRPPGPAPGG
jgi:hypothetical protein